MRGRFPMSGSTPPQATADNPYLADLNSLKLRLGKEVATLENSLKTTCSDMSGKKTWVGATADTWTSDVVGRRKRIQTLLGKLIPIVDAEIKKTPEKVTPLEAKMYRMPY
jgi:hypothetical protein